MKMTKVVNITYETTGDDNLEDIFKFIDDEKRDKIINSAMEEFSLNTFNKASTNNIVKRAGISKGTLFNYFKNKQTLYDYLMKFTMDTMFKEVVDKLKWEETDILIRIKDIIVIKMRIMRKYPWIPKFTKKMYEGRTIEEIKALVEEKKPNLYDEVYTKNINFELFKEGVDVMRVVKMTQFTLEGLSEQWLNTVDNEDGCGMESVERLLNEIDDYLDLIKNAFYKEGVQ